MFDITNQQNPQLLSTATTQLTLVGGSQAVLGTNLFLFSGADDANQNPVIFTVDTTDPVNPVIKTYTVPGVFDNLVVVGNPVSATGTLDPSSAVLALRRPGRVVVVDEAFMDLVPGEPATLVRERLGNGHVVKAKVWVRIDATRDERGEHRAGDEGSVPMGVVKAGRRDANAV